MTDKIDHVKNLRDEARVLITNGQPEASGKIDAAANRLAELEAANADLHTRLQKQIQLRDEFKNDLIETTKRRLELEAVLAKLPKTADGVPVTPGMTLYLLSEHKTNPAMMELVVGGDKSPNAQYCWYSTREAALSANGGGE